MENFFHDNVLTMTISTDDFVLDLVTSMVDHVATYMMPREHCHCHGFTCDDGQTNRCPERAWENDTPITDLISARQTFIDSYMDVKPNLTTKQMYDNIYDAHNDWLNELNQVALLFRIPGLPPHLEPNVNALQLIMLYNRFSHFLYWASVFGWDDCFIDYTGYS